jgi:PAS domain S-box-containing protein
VGITDDDQPDATPAVSAGALAQVLEMVSEAVTMTDAAGVITFWNDAASNMFGYARSEVLGQDLIDVLTTAAGRDQASATIEQAKSGRAWQGELPIRRRDGSVVEALVTVQPLSQPDRTFAGLAAIAQDVSARNNAPEDLHRSDHIFQALLLASEDLFAVTDADGTIRSIVGPVADKLGRPPTVLLGSSLFDLVAVGDLERAEQLWATRVSTTGPIPAQDFWIKRPDDTWCCLSLIANNLLGVAGIEGISLTCRDVTERKQLEQERVTLAGMSAALVSATTESDLFGEICRVLVQGRSYHLAWIGLADPSQPLGVRMIGPPGTSLAFFEALQHLAGESVHQGALTTALETREMLSSRTSRPLTRRCRGDVSRSTSATGR